MSTHALFLRCDFADSDGTSHPLLLWNGQGAITLSGTGNAQLEGKTFTGSGTVLEWPAVESTSELEAKGLTLTLSGIPSALVSLALQARCRRQPVYLWRAELTATGTLAYSPVEIFGGICDSVGIADSGSSSAISIQAESHLILLKKARVSRYTHAEQTSLYPSDNSMKFVTGIQDKKLWWGMTKTS